MSLFNLTEIDIEPETGELVSEFSEIANFSATTKFILSKNRQSVAESFPEIIEGITTAYMSAGRWSAHDLLFYLLSITGPAKVYFTTWAINETAARLLAKAMETGMISELYFIFDRRIEIRNPNVLQLIKDVATKFIFIDCHAKNFVLENDKWMITNIGSANMSNNKRIEAGVLITEREVGIQFKNLIMDLIEEKNVIGWK